MPAVVVVGAQWGDEGKGKVVDLYARYADLIVRYAGGANAGHTLVVKGEKLVLHLVPSGILHEGKRCLIASGTVIDPAVLLQELDAVEARGVNTHDRVFLADRAHVVLPLHPILDGIREQGTGALGTTRRGIGPCYEDKVARRGVRIGDLLRPETLRARVSALYHHHAPFLAAAGVTAPDLEQTLSTMLRMGERLAPRIVDGTPLVSEALTAKQNVLLEGAQGALLDVDHGTYPFVTSSHAAAGGASVGAGIGPTRIDSVVGIAKAYATRVGDGPFPTELFGDEGDALRTAGAEFGATTGRPRRCGFFDAVALRRAAQVSGLDLIAVTKLDVLSGLPRLRICVAYEVEGERRDAEPYDGLGDVTPIYEDLPGFEGDLSSARRVEDLPTNARRYLARLEELVGVAIGPVSVGADREATADLADPFDLQ